MKKRTYWMPHGAVDAEVASLMEQAARALHDEDKRIKKMLVTASKRGAVRDHPAVANVGHGLSYWVYETTLVYLIWRAWFENERVTAWDWTLREHEVGRRVPAGDGGLRYDLVLYGDSPTPQMVFEAKWWNVDKAAVRASLDEDVVKLRGSQFFESARKFLLVFWHEETDMLDEVEKYCVRPRLALRGTARFGASFRAKNRTRVEGAFVIGLLEVLP